MITYNFNMYCKREVLDVMCYMASGVNPVLRVIRKTDPEKMASKLRLEG